MDHIGSIAGKPNLQESDQTADRLGEYVVSTMEKLAPVVNPTEETLLRVVQILRGMVDSAGQTDDVHEIKSKLADCLRSLLEEVERRHGVARPGLDPATGLPDRAAAEEAILRVYAADTPACVGVVVVDRLTTLNLRFGNKVGDGILRHYADTLRQQLPAEDQLFRWNGPALTQLPRFSGSRIDTKRLAQF